MCNDLFELTTDCFHEDDGGLVGRGCSRAHRGGESGSEETSTGNTQNPPEPILNPFHLNPNRGHVPSETPSTVEVSAGGLNSTQA